MSVFSALQYKSPESKFIPSCTTSQNGLLIQTIAFGTFITSSDATVIAVIFTVIGKLYQTTLKYTFSIYFICIGFLVWSDMINLVRKKKRMSVYSKFVLVITAVLLIGGTVIFLAAEYNNPQTLGEESLRRYGVALVVNKRV